MHVHQFPANVGRKLRDSSWCPFNRACPLKIWGPLNTGFTVTHLQLLLQLFLQRQWLSTLQLAASAGSVINRDGIYPSLPRCVVSLEVQGLEWLLFPTRILLDMWHASF